MDKIVLVHTYRTRCSTVRQPPGFGDFLRGSLALATLSERKRFDLVIDFHQHPMQLFMEGSYMHESGLGEVHEFFNERANLLNDYIDSLGPNQTVRLTTHAYPDDREISEEAREIVRSQLRFNALVVERVRAIQGQFSGQKYAVLHLRVPDESAESFEAEEVILRRLKKYVLTRLVREWGKNVAVLSNNEGFKRTISSLFGFSYIDTEAVHLGECRDSGLDVRDTLVDFALMSQASAIHSYSSYSWKSGFSRQCAELYGVPFFDVKPIVERRVDRASLGRFVDWLKRWFRRR